MNEWMNERKKERMNGIEKEQTNGRAKERMKKRKKEIKISQKDHTILCGYVWVLGTKQVCVVNDWIEEGRRKGTNEQTYKTHHSLH